MPLSPLSMTNTPQICLLTKTQSDEKKEQFNFQMNNNFVKQNIQSITKKEIFEYLNKYKYSNASWYAAKCTFETPRSSKPRRSRLIVFNTV